MAGGQRAEVEAHVEHRAALRARVLPADPRAEQPAAQQHQPVVPLADGEVSGGDPSWPAEAASASATARRAGGISWPRSQSWMSSADVSWRMDQDAGSVNEGSGCSVDRVSRIQPSFSSLMCWMATALALASRSGSAWYSDTQQRYTW